MKKEKYTWNDLEKDIQKLTPEQRKNKVCIAIDDEGYFKIVQGFSQVENDIYFNKEDSEDARQS